MSQLKVDLPSHISSDDARLLLSFKLYEVERLSLRKAAELAGCSNQKLFGGRSVACDFVDLVQNGFGIRPVVPLQGLI